MSDQEVGGRRQETGDGRARAVRYGTNAAVLIVAVVGIAITLHMILKRYNSLLARGYVALRVIESAILIAGVVAGLSLIALSDTWNSANVADHASLEAIAVTLLARIFGWDCDFDDLDRRIAEQEETLALLREDDPEIDTRIRILEQGESLDRDEQRELVEAVQGALKGQSR